VAALDDMLTNWPVVTKAYNAYYTEFSNALTW
jgi:hypothetical protein